MLHRLATAISVTALVLLVGCSGDGDSKPASGDTAAKTVANDEPELADDDIKAVLEAFAGNEPAEIEETLDLVAPGSVAEAYARYQIASNNAAIDGGTPYEIDTLKKVDDGYEACTDTSDRDTCAVWGDFESKDGKLANLTVNGKKIADRLTVGDGSSTEAGSLADVEFLAAYKSVQSGDLFVLVSVTSGKRDINISQYEATYRGTDKRQSTASSGNGPTELAADSKATVAMIFKSANIGGKVKLEILDENYEGAQTVTLRTK